MRLHDAARIAAGLSLMALVACTSSSTTPSNVAGADGSATPPLELAVGEWTRLPDSPLSPRHLPVAAHVPTVDGDLAVFVGGQVSGPCPPWADCAIPPGRPARDGAALDLTTGTWQPIADAPRPVPGHSPTAVVDDTLYVLTERRLLAWEAAGDAWTEVDLPRRVLGATMVADTHAGRSRLVITSGSDENGIRPDLVHDLEAGTWSRLPANPLRPSFDRTVVATPEGLVLLAKPMAPDGGPEDPALVRAAVLPPGATDWELVTSGGEQLGGWSWTWTGTRVLDPTPGGSDGGQVNNYGREIPYGGAFDPATREWISLEGTPKAFTGGWPVEAPGGRFNALSGWVHDDGEVGRAGWTRLRRPEGAPEEPGRGVWVGAVLVVHGGGDWEDVKGVDEWTPENVWSTGVWVRLTG